MLRSALLALALAAAPLAAQESGIPVGDKAPAGPLVTLEGKPVDLGDYFGKGPVVVEFWATWCPSCTTLEPAIRKAMAAHPDVTFVTIAVSVNQSLARVKAWQAQHKLPGVLLYDQKGDVSGAYDVPATSYVVVVDKAGVVRYTGVGGTQDIEAAIRKAR
jgi:peroxiredoxin